MNLDKELRETLKKHREFLEKRVKSFKAEIERKQKEIERKIEAINVLIGPKIQIRNREGIHCEIKNLLYKEGPKEISEIASCLVEKKKLKSKQPWVTVYSALKRRHQDFYQRGDKKWYLINDTQMKKETGEFMNF